MNKLLYLIVSCLFFISLSSKDESDLYVRGTRKPVISLNGIW